MIDRVRRGRTGRHRIRRACSNWFAMMLLMLLGVGPLPAVAAFAPRGAADAPAPDLATWSDPAGAVSLRYPADWTKLAGTDDGTVAYVSDGAGFAVSIYFPRGNEIIDRDLQSIRDSTAKSDTGDWTFDPPLDTTVGGLPARSMAYRHQMKEQPNDAPKIGTYWLLEYRGRRYEFRCEDFTTHRAEIEALMGSVTFTPASVLDSQTRAWADPLGVIRLQLPSEWSAETSALTYDNSRVLTLTGPGTILFVSMHGLKANETLADIVKVGYAFAHNDKTPPQDLSPLRDTTVGGEPALTFSYSQPCTVTTCTAPAFMHQSWYVIHGNWWFDIDTDAPAASAPAIAAIAAIVASSTFPSDGGKVAPTGAQTDAKGQVRMQYPTDWQVFGGGGVTAGFTLQGPDDASLILVIADPAPPLADQVRSWQEGEANALYSTYEDGPVNDATVGGEPALTYPYVQKDKKTGAGTSTGKLWFVNHGGKAYVITALNTDLATMAEAEAIVGSLTFLR